MRNLGWIGVGWIGLIFFSALGARTGGAHVLPDFPVIVVVFLAMRREPVPVALSALALGYLAGRQALAPMGLQEVSLVLVAMGVYLAAGNLSGNGGLFFGFICAVAVMGYHLLLFAMLLWQRGQAGFASWATAVLLPDGLATFLLAIVCHPFMLLLERRLTQDKREGLSWR